MKTIILCGGLGTRLSEETTIRPKPMVEIGGRPMLWHIMNIYARHGMRDFLLALGYKGEVIKDYFVNYYVRRSDITVDLGTGRTSHERASTEDWQVTMVDTGEKTLTGGRIKRLAPQLNGEERFMATYGDGVAPIDIQALLEFHSRHGRLATVTAVRPPARFGAMIFDGDMVIDFHEKPQTGEGWINGGFFVFERKVLDYISGDETILEKDPLERLAADGQLAAFRHHGFWKCMDTIRDRQVLEELWSSGTPPWISGP